MKIVCMGGGPAGLYFALLMKKQNPDHQITVIERLRQSDTFGWGVSFSGQTFEHLRGADEASGKAILQAFRRWDQLHVEYKGCRITSRGHDFCAIGRRRLLGILQERCTDLGVQQVFEHDIADDQAVAAQYQADLVIAADGMGSRIRARYADTFGPNVEARKCRFVWLGTRKRFDGFTFSFEETEHGWFQSHAYHFDDEYSTFIIETTEEVWQKAGLGSMSMVESLDFCEKLFCRQLDGQTLLFNPHLRGSGLWTRFSAISCRQWLHVNRINGKDVPLILLGDAAHTAHFSAGMGTRLALEGAIELARCLSHRPDQAAPSLMAALLDYQQKRMLEVHEMQISAANSMAWFENAQRYTAMEAPQFAYSLLTRSQRLSHEGLRQHDAQYVRDYEGWLACSACKAAGLPEPPEPAPLPMQTPYCLKNTVLHSRLVVPAGLACPPQTAGAGLVVFDDAASADLALWQAAAALVHRQAGGAALRLAMPTASLDSTDLVNTANAAQMQSMLVSLRQSASLAEQAGFDWLELNCSEGLLADFLSPGRNLRLDEFGGLPENRCRFPLQVFAALRAVWPQQRPLAVCLSGADLHDDVLSLARRFQQAGADLIDCTGPDCLAHSDRIRNEAGIPTMVSGAVFSNDQVNGLIAAGRADLCMPRLKTSESDNQKNMIL
jgi:anthraniloyl-CoA monooxygenase